MVSDMELYARSSAMRCPRRRICHMGIPRASLGRRRTRPSWMGVGYAYTRSCGALIQLARWDRTLTRNKVQSFGALQDEPVGDPRYVWRCLHCPAAHQELAC